MPDTQYMRIATTEWLALNRTNQQLTTQIDQLQQELQILRLELQSTGHPLASVQPPKPAQPATPTAKLTTAPVAPETPGPVLADTPAKPVEQAPQSTKPAQPAPLPAISKADEGTPESYLTNILDKAGVPRFEPPTEPPDPTNLLTTLIQQAPPPTQIAPSLVPQPPKDGQPSQPLAVPKTNIPYDSIWSSVATQPAHQVLLTPAAVRTAMIAIELGTTRKSALALIGVTKRRYTTYEQQARNGMEPYQTLFDLMDVAEARLELKLTDRWVGHTIDSWQAAQALLARRKRDDWGETPAVNLSLSEMAKLSLEQLAEIIGPEALAFLQQEADSLIEQSYTVTEPEPPLLAAST